MYEFDAEVWRSTSAASWHFLTVPAGISDDIEARSADGDRGFGSVPVEATIGETTWRTSLFPDSARGAYVLPVKQQVRRAEGIAEGDPVTVVLGLVVA